MGEVSYAPLIKDMTWSYSRLKSFRDCPYHWFLRYVRKAKGEETFFASFGSFMHRLLDLYYREGMSSQELVTRYLTGFSREVRGIAPSQKVYTTYFRDGLEYFKNFHPLPFKLLDTEVEARFKVGDIPMVGFLDYLGEADGKLYIIDHKSRALKPRSGRRQPTQSDQNLDSYLVQLYLYAVAIHQKFGEYPAGLGFNCFRTQTLILEPFQLEKLREAELWAQTCAGEIIQTEDFLPDLDWFKCSFLCEYKDQCEYFEMWRR